MSSAALETEPSARAHHLPAAGLVALAVAVLVGLPEFLGDTGRIAGVAVVQLAFVAGWVLAAGLEGMASSLGIGAAAAAGADLALLLPARPELGALLAVLGVGFLAVVVQQMLRHPRNEPVASLSGSLLQICALCALAALLVLGRSAEGRQLATTGLLAVGAALVVGHLVDLVFPRPQLAPGVPRGLTALLASVVAGAVVAVVGHGAGTLVDGLSAIIFGTVLGAVAGLIAVAASYAVIDAEGGDRPPRRWSLPLVQALLPIAACAPVALALQSVL